MRRTGTDLGAVGGVAGARHAAPSSGTLRYACPILAFLGAVLVLTGCAAGSPSVVAPVAPESSEVLVPEAPEAAPPVVAAPDPTAPAADAAPAPIQQPAAPPAAETTEPAPSGPSAAAPETAAFAREAPTVTAPVAAPQPAVAHPALDAASAAQTAANRPPPPPDPGTGLSTLIEGGSNGRREVALTFDAGADTGYGAAILDLLRDEGILATFGMTGVYAQANPALVQRMAAEGHQIINHTWDHPSLTGANTGQPRLTPEQLAQQLGDTEAVVAEVADGYQMRPYFRPPYGDYDADALAALYANGYSLTIMWTCDTQAWRGWSAQEIIDYCTTNIRPHEILLMHLGSDARGDYEALPGMIQFFRNSGYAFVTIEQMLQP